jgi:predicted Fe-Mo cluster-binding NifX family protein
MKAAISSDNNFVSAHFGRCPYFTVVEMFDGEVKNVWNLDNPGHSPGLIPEFLHKEGIDCIIAGGMGNRAQMFFEEYGIKTILGVSGAINDVIKQLEKGTLIGGKSLCSPGSGKGYGVEKDICDHGGEE